MKKINLSNIRYPGLRNIKTALSILIIMVLYEITGNDNAVMASIAAIVCMQDSVNKTFQEGMLRILGTLFGGACGVLFTLFNLHSSFYLIRYTWITLGIILIIYICNSVRKPEIIVNSVIVFIVIVFKPDDLPVAPVLYSIRSIYANITGIIVAICVNKFFFPPKPEKVVLKRLKNEKMKINYEIINFDKQKVAKWSGGETTELLIYPPNSLFKEKKFKWRLSTATVENESSNFTKFKNYYRHLMVLKGEVKLIHNYHHTVSLGAFEKDFFNGEWETSSIGRCTDLNLIVRKGIEGNISTTPIEVDNDFVNFIGEDKWYHTTIFYVIEDSTVFTLKKDNKEYVYETLNKGDIIVFSKITQNDIGNTYICSKLTIRIDVEI